MTRQQRKMSRGTPQHLGSSYHALLFSIPESQAQGMPARAGLQFSPSPALQQVTRGLAGSVVTSITGRLAPRATVPGSRKSSFWLISHQVSARYIAPVSR